jgi:hypothetical protein
MHAILRSAGRMFWTPAHGDRAFTVPMFDECMRRITPGDVWRA